MDMKELYRHYILEILKKWERSNYDNRRIIILPQEMETLSSKDESPLRKDSIDKALVDEIVNDLFFERIIDITNKDNPHHATNLHMNLTRFGKKIINEADVDPTDELSYFCHLKNSISDLDAIIYSYIKESVEAYNNTGLKW